jgi:hypothetical protein
MEMATEYAPELPDSLFDEITQVNDILEAIPDGEFNGLTAEKKWQRIFNADLPGLYCLVSKFLSIPASNACVERIFSLCSAQWTDVRNRLHVGTVKSLIQVKANLDYSCSDFYEMIISDKKLLKSVMDSEKYVHSTK